MAADGHKVRAHAEHDGAEAVARTVEPTQPADAGETSRTAAGGEAARETLTRARIVDLALAIIDRAGLGALNMRRLAADAGVKPMSLYHHFANKEAILDAVAEAIAAAAVGLPPTQADWREQVRFQFTALHLLIQAHPRALPLISTGVVRTPSGRRWMEGLMRALLEAGFAPQQAGRVYHQLGAFTLGLGYARLLALDVPAESIVGELVGHWGDYPHLMRVGLQLSDWDRPGEFEAGFDALLARLAEELTNL